MGPASGMVVEHGGDASWTVLLEPAGGPVIPCVGRVVRLRPVPNLEELPPCLDPLSPHLQTVGVAGLGEERAENLARALGILGASRVTPFAAVPFPPPWWHHDGGGPLTDLVRWVDLESG